MASYFISPLGTFKLTGGSKTPLGRKMVAASQEERALIGSGKIAASNVSTQAIAEMQRRYSGNQVFNTVAPQPANIIAEKSQLELESKQLEQQVADITTDTTPMAQNVAIETQPTTYQVSQFDIQQQAPLAWQAIQNTVSAPEVAEDSILDSLIKQLSNITQMEETARIQQTGLIGKLMGKQEKSRATMLSQQLQKFGVLEKYGQVQNLGSAAANAKKQLESLVNQERAAMTKEEDRLAPMSFIRAKQNQIAEKFAYQKAAASASASALSAQYSAIKSDFSIAQGLAKDAVNAMVYDQERAYNQLKDFISINKSIINDLSNERRWLFDNALNIRERELKNAREDRNFVFSLALNPDTAPAFLGANLKNINVTQAVMTANTFIATKVKNPEYLSISECKTLGVPYGTTKSMAFGITPEDPPRLLTMEESRALGVPFGLNTKEVRGLNLLEQEKKLNTQILEVGGRKILIDKQTGETIRDFGLAELPEQQKEKTYAPPTTFKEWELAGGEAGTGMTYAQWIDRKTISTVGKLPEPIVGWSQHAAEAGVVGMPVSQAAAIYQQKAAEEKTSIKEAEKNSVLANISSWIAEGQPGNKEDLINQLVASHKNIDKSFVQAAIDKEIALSQSNNRIIEDIKARTTGVAETITGTVKKGFDFLKGLFGVKEAQAEEPVTKTYLIKSGDTLGAIANKNNTTISAIMKLNPKIKDPNKIYAGDTIILP